VLIGTAEEGVSVFRGKEEREGMDTQKKKMRKRAELKSQGGKEVGWRGRKGTLGPKMKGKYSMDGNGV